MNENFFLVLLRAVINKIHSIVLDFFLIISQLYLDGNVIIFQLSHQLNK